MKFSTRKLVLFFILALPAACATRQWQIPKLAAYAGEPIPESEAAVLRLSTADSLPWVDGYLIINQHRYVFDMQYEYYKYRGTVPTYKKRRYGGTLLFEQHDLLLKPGEQTVAYRFRKVRRSDLGDGPYEGEFKINMVAGDRFIMSLDYSHMFRGKPWIISVKDLDTQETIKKIALERQPQPPFYDELFPSYDPWIFGDDVL